MHRRFADELVTGFGKDDIRVRRTLSILLDSFAQFRFHMRLQLLLLPPSRRNQLLKLMATGWRFVAGDAALSFCIASNASR